MKQQELLEKYLAGTLNKEDTNEFNALRESDQDFDAEVTFHEDISEVIREEERVRLKSILTQKDSPKTSRSKSLLVVVLVGVLIGLFLAGIYIYQNRQQEDSPELIYASYFEPYPNTYRPVSRNATNSIETQGFTAYENGNYELAAQKFEEVLIENDDSAIIFYLGMSYAANGRHSLAIENLERLRSIDFAYSTEVYWYLGLYYLRQNDLEKASLNFQEYIDSASDKDQIQRAQEILEKIN